MKDFDQSYELEEVSPKGDLTGRTITVSREERFGKTVDERTFKIGGESFVRRAAVAPEATMRWFQMINGEIGDEVKDEASGTVRLIVSEVDALVIYDETVLALLEPGQEDLWKKVRDPEAAKPLTMTDIRAVIRWLIGENSGRPTGPPSDSSSGSGGTAMTSTGGSSLPAAPASES